MYPMHSASIDDSLSIQDKASWATGSVKLCLRAATNLKMLCKNWKGTDCLKRNRILQRKRKPVQGCRFARSNKTTSHPRDERIVYAHVSIFCLHKYAERGIGIENVWYIV